MVEDDHAVVEGEREVGQPAVVGRDVGEVLGVADGVVSRIADGPAGEPGEPRQVDGPVPFDQLLRDPRNGSAEVNRRAAPGSRRGDDRPPGPGPRSSGTARCPGS